MLTVLRALRNLAPTYFGRPLIISGNAPVTITAGVNTNLQPVTVAIDQGDMPVDQLALVEFDTDLQVVIIRRTNAVAGQIQCQLLYIGNQPQVNVIARWAIIRTAG